MHQCVMDNPQNDIETLLEQASKQAAPASVLPPASGAFEHGWQQASHKQCVRHIVHAYLQLQALLGGLEGWNHYTCRASRQCGRKKGAGHTIVCHEFWHNRTTAAFARQELYGKTRRSHKCTHTGAHASAPALSMRMWIGRPRASTALAATATDTRSSRLHVMIRMSACGVSSFISDTTCALRSDLEAGGSHLSQRPCC
jgi:hypothetical protein